MEKLKLNIEDLQIDSFATDQVDDTRGTVRGNSGSEYCGLTSLKYYLGGTWMQQK